MRVIAIARNEFEAALTCMPENSSGRSSNHQNDYVIGFVAGQYVGGITTRVTIPQGSQSSGNFFHGDIGTLQNRHNPPEARMTFPGVTKETDTELEANTPFAVSATSVSSGAVTYTVVSGPATIAGKHGDADGIGHGGAARQPSHQWELCDATPASRWPQRLWGSRSPPMPAPR
jgi:hypothetical protein